MEAQTRKIGESMIYRDVLEVLYPGERVHINVIVTSAGPETVFLVEPQPGLHGWWLRMRWRLYGRFREGEARLQVRYGKSWHDVNGRDG